MSAGICALETFVHAAGRPSVPFMIVRHRLPDNAGLYWEPAPESLPEGWQMVPADRPSMAYGTAWLQAGAHLGLIVPSVVLPLERNLVLNPAHPAISQVKVDAMYTFTYDDRMLHVRHGPHASCARAVPSRRNGQP